jgi:hypothetical protein
MSEQTTTGAGSTLNVTDRELYLIRAALQSYLASFSHTEGTIVDETKRLLTKLPTTGDPGDDVNRVFPERTNRLTL